MTQPQETTWFMSYAYRYASDFEHAKFGHHVFRHATDTPLDVITRWNERQKTQDPNLRRRYVLLSWQQVPDSTAECEMEL